MSEYLPSFLVDPVLRQARRLSRISTGEESPGFLPQVPDLQRWNPTRFWNTSPPPSIDEVETTETTVQSIARTIQLWTNQINDLDVDPLPSPPLDSMDGTSHSRGLTQHENPSTVEFPPLEPQAPQVRPHLQEHSRTSSAQSLNPAQELATRARVLSDVERVHSQSDPLSSLQTGQSSRTAQRESLRGHEFTMDGYIRRRDGSDTLPEDDGMGPLRQRINAIWESSGTPAEKSKLIHALMTERYRIAHKLDHLQSTDTKIATPQRIGSPMSIVSRASQEPVFNLSDTDLTPTYALPEEQDPHEPSMEQPKPHLGCVHYMRNNKMQCVTCDKWYTCRLCHDEAENHTLPRQETKYMLCMLCNTPQRVSQICKMCNHQMACYYCPICKLWNNDPEKSVYHCDDCGICRLGEGLGKDFFHCKTCSACMSIQAEKTHRCIEKSTKCDCPICGEYMFTSSKSVAFMRCGHSIHESCFAEWCNTSYKCPICSKSIANMESQFRRLDRHIADQPMPEEYSEKRAYVFCNDCNSRSVTSYHWLGLKCSLCESYNTAQLEMLGPDTAPRLEEVAERVQQAGEGEAGITASQSHTPTEELTSPAITAGNAQPAVAVLARSPTVGSPWLMPHSPASRSARSQSPIVGSYFGTGTVAQAPRRGTPMEDDDDLDFWGAQSPRSQDALAAEDSEESSSSSDDVDAMDEDDEDDQDEDEMDIFGHR